MHFKFKTISGRKYLYVIKNERIDGKVVQTIQKYVGTADQVYDLIMEPKETRIASYSFGKPAALLKAAEEVGLIEAMNKYVDRKIIKGGSPLFRVDIITKTNAGKLKKHLIHKE